MTKSSTFGYLCKEILWLVRTEHSTNGMDFRVGFMKDSVVMKHVTSRYEVERGLFRQTGWYRGFNIIRPNTIFVLVV